MGSSGLVDHFSKRIGHLTDPKVATNFCHNPHMTPDLAKEFFRLLANFSPPWVLTMLVAVVLAWRTPEIIRELRRKRP